MRKIQILMVALLPFMAIQSSLSQGVVYASNEKEHKTKVLDWRKQKDADYKTKEKTMLTDELLANFEKLNYYDVDYSYRVESKLTKYADGRTFEIQTTGGQVYTYLIFGQATFTVGGKSQKLNVYRSQRSAKAGTKKGALFIPFTDETSSDETFGGGRYLVLDVPDSNLLTLDFNMAYNPYCLYNEGHSCPIPPKANRLNVPVTAGELMYP